MMKKGIELITAERKRQVEKEGWTAAHDSTHEDGELALAAICYAAPVKIFQELISVNSIGFTDPWPWEDKWDKRYEYGENRKSGKSSIPDPATYNKKQRIDLLSKAGALIAAEIDRLQATE